MMRPRKVESYMRDMVSGEWVLTHQPIASGCEVTRQEKLLIVADRSAGVSGRLIKAGDRGYAELRIALRDSDEVLLHEGDLEVYIAIDRLSDLHAMLGLFLVEMKSYLKESG